MYICFICIQFLEVIYEIIRSFGSAFKNNYNEIYYLKIHFEMNFLK